MIIGRALEGMEWLKTKNTHCKKEGVEIHRNFFSLDIDSELCYVSIFAMLTEISGIDTNINGNAVSSQGVVHQLWQISIYRHYWRCAQAKKTLPPQYWEPNIKRLNEVQSVKIRDHGNAFFFLTGGNLAAKEPLLRFFLLSRGVG